MPPIKIASGLTLEGKIAGIMILKNMKKNTTEINSAQKKSSMRLRDKMIPIEPAVRTIVAKTRGNLLNFYFSS